LGKKNLGQKVSKKYSPEVRQFALSLHFFSVKAYVYVRKQFNTILPHPRTLSKWYSHVNADLGFTKEALKSLSLKVKHSTSPIYCSLMMDEMAIRQNIEFDSSDGKYYIIIIILYYNFILCILIYYYLLTYINIKIFLIDYYLCYAFCIVCT